MSIIRLIIIAIIFVVVTTIGSILILIDRKLILYYYLQQFFARSILFASGVKVQVTGKENIAPNTPYVFVANHASMFDIPLMQWLPPKWTYIVFKKELAKIPIFGWQMLIGPYVVIDRENPEKAMKSIERSKRLMEEKKISILIFAEGTRSKTGEVQPFKRGAFYLASRVQHPIIPVSIGGTDKVMSKGSLHIKPRTIYVHFGEPIDTSFVKNRVHELALMEQVRDAVIRNRTVED